MKTIFGVLVVATLVVGGCKKEEGAEKAPDKTDVPEANKTADDGKKIADDKAVATYETPEKKLARFKECWELGSDHSKLDVFSKCYAENTEMKFVDFVPPLEAKTPAEVKKNIGMMQTAIPDFKATPQLTLVSGGNIAAIVLEQGTNSGEMMGMPASNKKYGLLHAQMTQINDEGQVTRDYHLADQLSMLSQLEVVPEPMRANSAPMMESGWGESIEIFAKDDDVERANVEVVKEGIAAVTKGDIAGLMALCADDASFHYVAGKEGPGKDKKAYEKSLGEFIAMTSERTLTPKNVWGAGDWVAAEVETSLTMSVDLGPLKTKGKKATQTEFHFFQLSDKKIKKHLLFSNDLSMMTQLGVIDPAAMAGGGDAKAPAQK